MIILSKLRPVFILIFILISFFCSAQQDETIYNDSSFIYRSLSEALVHPENVYRLNLSKSKLDSFPDDIFLLKNLVELDISKNNIEELPDRIGELKNLRILRAGNNHLVHLPESIGQLQNLEVLSLNRNVIVDLPHTIGQLQNLQVLELWDNEIESLPEELGDLNNLKVLELRGIIFTDEEQHHIDSLITKSAKIHMSPSCNCKN